MLVAVNSVLQIVLYAPFALFYLEVRPDDVPAACRGCDSLKHGIMFNFFVLRRVSNSHRNDERRLVYMLVLCVNSAACDVVVEFSSVELVASCQMSGSHAS